MSARRHTLQCISPTGLHTLSYKEWGEPDNPAVLVCVHGVTRVADDFDVLAERLQHDYRVICPDIVGRGESGRLRNPMDYQVPQYVSDMVTLIARLNVAQVAWLGTSMGGLIGMGLAALPGSPVKRLILNDVGPVLQPDAIARIAQYIAKELSFDNLTEAESYVREVSASFGPHNDAQWQKMTRDVFRQHEDGKWRRNYDPALVQPILKSTPEMAALAQTMLWAAYDAITCPTLLIRGEESDLLSLDTAQAMQQRGPKASLHQFAGVGHAPTFVHPEQIQVVAEFLAAD